jgi:Tol biopolymer transport system component
VLVRIALATSLIAATSGCAYLTRLSNSGPVPGSSPTIAVVSRPSLSANGAFAVWATRSESGVPSTTTAIVRRDYANQQTARVDVANDGTPADDSSYDPAISADGRYVAFASDADNLVPNDGDQNLASDIFVRDMVAGTTTRVSVMGDGSEADSDSYAPSISADGRYVGFTSDSDLIDADGNGSSDVYRYDRVTHAVTLASIWTNGTQTDFGAWDGEISGDGQHMTFTTDTDLAGGDTNFDDDVYVRNFTANTTMRVSVIASGGESGVPSNDGHYIVWIGADGNVYRRDTVAPGNVRVNPTSAPGFEVPAISADGRWIAYMSLGNATGTDTNGLHHDIFLKDMVSGTTTLGSTDMQLNQLQTDSDFPTLSADGRYVAWVSAGAFDGSDTNGVTDVYVRAVSVPKITGVTPNTLKRGATTTIKVSGQAFTNPVTAMIGFGNVGVTVNSATWVSDTQVTVSVTASATATLGAQGVEIINQGTGYGMFGGALADCGGCLTITT